MSTSENNKRIAKNTAFLYVRMFLMMAVTLYTSRVILQTLGVEDFGIYNVVAGIVVLFSFINNAMSIASQRFLSFALGKNDIAGTKRVFSMSMTSHIAIALLVLLAAETLGLWLLWQMNFPENRVNAVGWVYQFAIFTCIINIIRIPYNASIIAYERMAFYAWISIIEVVLKLLIVYFLAVYDGDKLIFYSFLYFGSTLFINVIYKIYCNWKFITSRYSFFWDSQLFKKFISFSTWSLFGSLANVSATQGLNMIINIFCGVMVNAAVGISNQVMAALNSFLMNFQTAFNPQLIKSYATNDKEYFMKLIFKTSKFSYYLMLVLSLPILLNCDFLLHIWLGTVPKYATEFSRLIIIFLLFDAISGPLWISVQATGKIKKYQLLMAFLILLNLPFTFLILSSGGSPIYVFMGRVAINIITLMVRVVYLRSLIDLPARQYVTQVLAVAAIVSIVAFPIPFYLNKIIASAWSNLIIVSLTSVFMAILSIYILGLTKSEKKMVNTLIMTKVLKRQ